MASAATCKVEKGHQLYRDGKYKEALLFYTEALSAAKTRPQKIALHSNRAACYSKLHDFKKAEEECTWVLELDQKHSGALMLRAQTLVTLKEYHSALFDVTRLLELNPNSEVYQNLEARLRTQLLLKKSRKPERQELQKERRIIPATLFMDSPGSFTDVSSIEEKRVLEKSKSLLNWLTNRNFDKIKHEIVHTIRASPSAFVYKSLASCVFDMAVVETSSALFARLCVELFHELPRLPSDESHGASTTFEGLFLRKCQMELESSSSKTEQLPLAYVDLSNYYRFIKTLRVLAEVFMNNKITETTRTSITQVLMNPIILSSIGKIADFQFSGESFKELAQSSRAVELESNYNEEVKLKKEAEEALARKKEELEMMEGLLESYKEEQGTLLLQAQALDQKHEAELRLRKETEALLVIERERMEMVKLRLETVENESNDMHLMAEEFETKYKGELVLRMESETSLDKERKELEAVTQLLETYKTEQENLTSQVKTWQEMYEQESSLRKETEDAVSREKQELEIVKGLLEFYNREADALREEKDNALKLAQELMEKRQPPSSFFCPITQEVMKDPHFAADGFTYEAEAIKKWLSTGHQTSPMTNLKLPNLTLIPNRALCSAIQELV